MLLAGGQIPGFCDRVLPMPGDDSENPGIFVRPNAVQSIQAADRE